MLDIEGNMTLPNEGGGEGGRRGRREGGGQQCSLNGKIKRAN